MTIDERLEALTQSLELMAGLQRTTEINVSRLSDAMTRLSENQAKFEESHAKLEVSRAKTEKLLRRFGRFARSIARNRETRLFGLENPAT